MEVIHILVVNPSDKGLGIGFEGELPWHIPEDLKHFKSITKGNPVIMGRKTFESLPFKNGLPDRLNLVLSRSGRIKESEFVSVADNIDCLIDIAKDYNTDKVYIIGGAEVYKLTEGITNTKIVTVVSGCYECDTFLPEEYLSDKDFVKMKVIPLRFGCSVVTLKRKKN